ncbi:MAG: stage III sporulation protein AE [Clostridia bacterium]|nr:stage III sporulation protein AE [Clostridia bacterium]
MGESRGDEGIAPYKRFAALLVFGFVLACARSALAEGNSLFEGLGKVLGGVDFSVLDRSIEDLLGPNNGWNARQLVDGFARGQAAVDAGALWNRLLSLLLHAMQNHIALAIAVLVPAVLGSVLTRMRASFESEAVAHICHYACFALVCLPLVRSLASHIGAARQTMDALHRGMQALFPLLLTLLAAVGGSASSALLQPAVIAASGAMTTLVREVTLNLALCSAAVTVLDHLSEHMHLGRLAGLLRTAASWTLGVCFTVFIGVMAVQGMGAAAVDGVAIRTAKYAIDNFVPIVGGMFADTVDALVGSSLLVKNALGITGMLALAISLAAPLMNLLAAVLVYRLCAAVLEPVADPNLVACISDFSNILVLIFITLLCVGAMFFLLIAQLLAVGNLTVMLR